ncbi:MAG: glycogen debranching protein, partial [Candidatus Acidiferrales bacterium]
MSKGLGTLRSVEKWETVEGSPSPLGATWVESHQAHNFALYSRHATGVTLLLYRESDPAQALCEVRLDPRWNKTGRIWHCWVPADKQNGATLYAYKVEGPHDPARGHRFDPQKVLVDPMAREVFFPPGYSRAAACGSGPTDGVAPLGV